jgi:hypothetical protein
MTVHDDTLDVFHEIEADSPLCTRSGVAVSETCGTGARLHILPEQPKVHVEMSVREQSVCC